MNPKVSVIVCLYNVENYLIKNRLQDIYNQTFGDWELILVDDGSADGTSAFMDKEAIKDKRIKVIHKSNGGLGSARNAGLDIAQGEYICSFDVDDHIEPDMLQYCVEQMDKRKLEVLMFGFRAITPQFGTSEIITLRETEINNGGDLKDYFLDRILLVPNGNGFFWNKCYRRDFIEKYNLRFGNQRIQQDEVFNLKVYEHLEHCYISSRVFYHYYIYNSGNNRSRFIPDRFDTYKSVYQQFRILQNKWSISDQRFEDYLQRRIYRDLHDLLRFNLVHRNSTWSREKRLQELDKVLSDTEYRAAISYSGNTNKSFEQKLFEKAYFHRSIDAIKFLNFVYDTVRKVIHFIRF